MNGFTIAGHVAVDRVITPNGEYTQLGGPPSFASALGKALSFPIDVVTRIGADFPEKYLGILSNLGITVKPSEYLTTRFVIDYRREPREMRVPAKCEPIHIEEVLDAARLLICPIVDEINDDMLDQVDPDFLALDPQGLIRNIDQDHRVSPKRWQTKRC
jgi:hypothetical protein